MILPFAVQKQIQVSKSVALPGIEPETLTNCAAMSITKTPVNSIYGPGDLIQSIAFAFMHYIMHASIRYNFLSLVNFA